MPELACAFHLSSLLCLPQKSNAPQSWGVTDLLVPVIHRTDARWLDPFNEHNDVGAWRAHAAFARAAIA